ncbi:2-hydroxyacid dehydrogenase [Sagittula salina]|uniref:D-glycerate dehydrogenase n=1 Tax=Sagittula salina TaxID=2820268 RepID=A0A940RYS0_9RHOB|nr:D-glycerate dehydrogenase [Sagittula salina]MBP0481188.1 D-glycerate dehydrogenase [Sagittula salina]
MERAKVLVTRRWPAAVERRLAERFDVTFNEADRPMDVAALRAALTEYDAVLPTVTDAMGSEVFDGLATPRCRLLANYGVGFSHIDVAAAQRLGIAVTNTPDVLSDCTADIAMTLLLMAARRAGEGERELRAGQWSGWRPTHLVGTKVTGKVLGIIGYGRIGREMARRAHHGFGMAITVYNRSPIAPDLLAQCGARQLPLAETLAGADFVSLHCPGGAENRHLIDASRLAQMKPGAYLINTARGEVVDEAALVASIRKGHLRGAGLDVFEGEPRVSPELLECPGLVLLPHLGSATTETREAMGHCAIDNLAVFLDGGDPPNRVA